MSGVFAIVGPVFALIMIGAAAVRFRLLDGGGGRDQRHRVLRRHAVVAVRLDHHGPVAEAGRRRGGVLGGALVMFALGMMLARRSPAAEGCHASICALDASFGNTVMLGLPFVDAAYGPPGVANLLAIVGFQSVVLLPLATLFIEADGERGRSPLAVLRSALAGVVRNPIVMATTVAFFWRVAGLGLPVPVARLLALIGSVGPPLALFCLGATLPRPSWKELREVLLSGSLKLFVMPAVVGLVARAMGVTGLAFSVVVLTAAMPTGANAFLLARRFRTMMEASATTVAITTALSLFTLSALLAWLGG